MIGWAGMLVEHVMRKNGLANRNDNGKRFGFEYIAVSSRVPFCIRIIREVHASAPKLLRPVLLGL